MNLTVEPCFNLWLFVDPLTGVVQTGAAKAYALHGAERERKDLLQRQTPGVAGRPVSGGSPPSSSRWFNQSRRLPPPDNSCQPNSRQTRPAPVPNDAFAQYFIGQSCLQSLNEPPDEVPAELTKGSVVVVRPKVKHWHGAKADSWFSRVAFIRPGAEQSNVWLEPVDDEQYSRLRG